MSRINEEIIFELVAEIKKDNQFKDLVPDLEIQDLKEDIINYILALEESQVENFFESTRMPDKKRQFLKLIFSLYFTFSSYIPRNGTEIPQQNEVTEAAKKEVINQGNYPDLTLNSQQHTIDKFGESYFRELEKIYTVLIDSLSNQFNTEYLENLIKRISGLSENLNRTFEQIKEEFNLSPQQIEILKLVLKIGKFIITNRQTFRNLLNNQSRENDDDDQELQEIIKIINKSDNLSATEKEKLISTIRKYLE